MNVLDAMQSGLIRPSIDKPFGRDSAGDGLKYFADQVESAIAEETAKYVGAAFVTFDQDLPAGVPLGDPEHCWASQVIDRDWQPVGALVVWSSKEREDAHRADRLAEEQYRAENFHFLRSAGVEERG